MKRTVYLDTRMQLHTPEIVTPLELFTEPEEM
jgi:hypothetical protein